VSRSRAVEQDQKTAKENLKNKLKIELAVAEKQNENQNQNENEYQDLIENNPNNMFSADSFEASVQDIEDLIPAGSDPEVALNKALAVGKTGTNVLQFFGKHAGEPRPLRIRLLDYKAELPHILITEKSGRGRENRIPIASISDVYNGKQTEEFRRRGAKKIDPSLCFSIKTKIESLDFVCPTTQVRQNWVISLASVCRRENKNKFILHHLPLFTPTKMPALSRGQSVEVSFKVPFFALITLF